MIEERSRLYAAAAKEVYPTQKKIEALLHQAQPDTPSFRPLIARALLLTAYVKRRTNFLLLRFERDHITAGELGSAIDETVHYLRYCSVDASFYAAAKRSFSPDEAIAVYDSFEILAEALCEHAEELWVCLRDHELYAAAGPGILPDLPPTPLRAACKMEDGQLVVHLPIGGDCP